MTQPKVLGQPCQDCGTPYVQGPRGIYCKPCYIKWKNGQQSQPAPTNAPAPTYVPAPTYAPEPPLDMHKNDDIRANVSLKMVSEILAAGKIEIGDWEMWANAFYHYKPSDKPPF